MSRNKGFYSFDKYRLPNDSHEVRFKLLNPNEDAKLQLQFAVTYDYEPFSVQF